MEHGLLCEAKVVVALTIELVAVDAAEIADTRQSHGQKAIQELPHALATQGDVGADGLALTQVELRDRLLGLGDLRLLAGDQSEVLDSAFDELGVASCGANAHGDDDLLDASDLHRVGVVEFLLQLRHDLLVVLLLQARSCRRFDSGIGHASSFPDFLATRTRTVFTLPSRASSFSTMRTRVGCLVSGSMTITLER